jgi:dTDP-4-dehydrorhamnose 3,5-epimerase
MSTRFEILDTRIAGLKVLQRKPLGDRRGYLERLFCNEELQALAPDKPIAQINHTLTASRGTVRGLHYQRPPYAEIKFVSCLRGEVFDVAVDLRKNSPTFLQWHAEVLSAANHKTLVIPEGFAHGFQTIADDCEMLYFHTAPYQASAEAGMNALDPQLAIEWPLNVGVAMLSDRDRSHPMLTKEFKGFQEEEPCRTPLK